VESGREHFIWTDNESPIIGDVLNIIANAGRQAYCVLFVKERVRYLNPRSFSIQLYDGFWRLRSVQNLENYPLGF